MEDTVQPTTRVFLQQSCGLCCGIRTVFTDGLVVPYRQWLCRHHGEFGMHPCPWASFMTLLQPGVLGLPFVHLSGHSLTSSCPYLLSIPEETWDPEPLAPQSPSRPALRPPGRHYGSALPRLLNQQKLTGGRMWTGYPSAHPGVG